MPALLMAVLLAFSSPAAALADQANPWQPAPETVGEDTYLGFIDAPAPNAIVQPTFEVRGWVVDQTAEGWAGIDQVQVVQGALNEGGRVLANAQIAQDRPDVAQAIGNPFFAASGFRATVTGLGPGTTTLNLYIHTPGKGWWFRQFTVTVPAPPERAFSDDPLVVVSSPRPDERIDFAASEMIVSGFAIDRNAPPDTGVGGSGVKHVQVYLDEPRISGRFLGEATLGKESREARGFGERFGQAGFELRLHPSELGEDPHALFIYTASAVSDAEMLTIVPFRIVSDD
jgi:hypothetical protein